MKKEKKEEKKRKKRKKRNNLRRTYGGLGGENLVKKPNRKRAGVGNSARRNQPRRIADSLAWLGMP